MNIVFLLRPWPVYGGGETVTVLLANEFVKRGLGVHVLYTKDSPKEKQCPFIDSRIISQRVDDIVSNEECRSFTRSEIAIAKIFLDRYVVDNRIDVVINQWWPVGTIKGCPAKTIKCLHMCLFMSAGYKNLNANGLDLLKKMLGKTLFTYCHKLSRSHQVEEYLPYVDKYLFLSPCFREDYLRFRGIRKYSDKLDYCYNPLVINDNSELDLSSKRKKVLFVGRMYESHKRVSKILEVWKEIERDENLHEWTLELVGDGPDRLEYEVMVRSWGIQRVHFHGFQQPEKYYEEASIFLMTSTFEGWGMTLLESQRHGVVPVVYDTFSSVHDIIQSKHNGIIVEEGDEESYVMHLKNLMNNTALRHQMAINGFKTCKRFSVKEVADRWLMIFNQICYGTDK